MRTREVGCALPIGFIAFMIGLLVWMSNHDVIWVLLGTVVLVLLWPRQNATDDDEN